MAADDATKRPDFTIEGVTGLSRWGGHVTEEFLKELQGPKGRRAYREMRDNDPVVGALLLEIGLLIRRVTWPLSPADESPAAEEVATFVDSCFHDMSESWHDTTGQILSCLAWGWSYLETVFKLRGGDADDPRYRSKHEDGRIGWRKWSIRAQETLDEWTFDEDGGVRGMWQVAPPDYQRRFIPIEKALLFRTTSEKGNPEGRSLLRNAYRPWYFKKNIEAVEGIGVERDLAGLPVAWVPPELLGTSLTAAQTATINAIKDLVRNIRRDEQEGVVFPLQYSKDGHKTFDLTLLSTGGTRQFDTDKIIARYDQRIAMSVLADFLLLGHEAVGSKALSVDKTEMFMEAIGSFADGICNVVNQHAIPRLLRLNGIPMALRPELQHGKVDKTDVAKLVEAIKGLAGVGMPIFPNADVERFLYETLGLPVPVELGDGPGEGRARDEAMRRAQAGQDEEEEEVDEDEATSEEEDE